MAASSDNTLMSPRAPALTANFIYADSAAAAENSFMPMRPLKSLSPLAALTGLIAFTGCNYPPLNPEEPSAAQLKPIDYDRPVNPTGQSKPLALQLPDSAIFPIVNIYGELRPAVYRSGQAKAGLAFQQHTTTDEGHDADVVLDPTGKWLASPTPRHSERADIYLQRVDGASVIQLTNDPADDVQPCFSGDGTKIAFASSRSGNWDIYVMDLEGRNVEQLTGGASQDLHPSFAPDGNRLAFCSLA